MSNFKPYPIDTLDDCARHYVEPDKRYINCEEFGHCDGMNGGCWYCMEFTPYQFFMCRDENHLRHWMSQGKTKEEAMQIIEDALSRYPEKPHAVYEYELYLKCRSEYGWFTQKIKGIAVKIKWQLDKLIRKFKKPKPEWNDITWSDNDDGSIEF